MKLTLVNLKLIATTGIVILLATSKLYGQSSYSADLYYRINESELDASYRDNSIILSQIDSIIANYEVANIDVCASASPDGATSANEKLAQERLNSFVDYLVSTGRLSADQIKTTRSFVNWDGMGQLVGQSQLSDKEEIVIILNNEVATDAHRVDQRIIQLKRLNKGKTYQELRTSIFPHLRYSSITIDFNRPEPVAVLPEEPVTTVVEETIEEVTAAVPATTIAESTSRGARWNISTNMLYLAALAPNIAAEISLGKGFSIKGGWTYTWLKSDKRNKYWRLYGGELEVRKWLGAANKKNPFGGHHIGVGVQMGTYDFELTKNGQMSDFTTAISLYYGYSLPIAKRFNIDFGVGAGYVTGKYKKYTAEHGCYVYQSSHKRKYFGPTKLDISMVWLLGKGNVNPKYVR